MNKDEKSSLPILIKEFKKRWLFGLVSIEYYVENRRPDLKDGEYDGKYKHLLYFNVFFSKYCWVLHSMYFDNEYPYIKKINT